MRKIWSTSIFLFIMGCLAHPLLAQPNNQEKVDSLRKVLFTQKGEARAHTLFQLGLALSSEDIDQSLSHLNSALVMGKQYKDDAFVAKCNVQLASNQIRRGKWTDGLENAIQALPFFEEKQDTSNLIRVYSIMGNAYNELGLGDLALQYQLKVLEHINIKTETPLTLGRTYNNVANLYTKRGENDKAKDFYERSLNLFREAKDTVRYITLLNNMSAIYDKEESDIAIDSLEKALKMAERMQNPNLLSMVYFNISYQNTRAGRPETGWRFLQLSKEAYQKSQFRYLPPQFLLEEAAVYRNRKRYDSVEVILKRLLKVVEEQQMKDFTLIIYDQLRDLYKTLNNSDSALHYLELATAIRDSLEQEEKANLLAGLKIENEFTQKQKQLDQISVEKKSLNRKARIRYWLSVSVLLLVIGGLVYYISRLRKKN